MSESTLRRNCVISFAIAALVMAAPRIKAGTNTEAVDNDTGATETELDVDLFGDQTGNIDNYLNPFGPMGTESASYNGMSNETTVEFDAGANGTPVPENDEADVGLEDDHGDLVFNGKDWVSPNEMQEPAPTIDGTDESTGPNTEFEVVEGTIQTTGDAQSSQEYSEIEVEEGNSTQVEIGNNDSAEGNLYPFNFGYMLSPTQIPLDQLNTTDLPQSMFTPVPGLTNGTEIDPGHTLDSGPIDLPEPGCVTVLASAAFFLTGRRRRRI